MRTNLPVTQREPPFPDGHMLVSTTDLKGRITHCNASFIEVSGFTREELLGQPAAEHRIGPPRRRTGPLFRRGGQRKVRCVTALIEETTGGAQEQAAGMVRELASSASTMQAQAGSVEASLQVVPLSRSEVASAVDAVALRRQMKALTAPAVNEASRLQRA